jgi:hypothetical protein
VVVIVEASIEMGGYGRRIPVNGKVGMRLMTHRMSRWSVISAAGVTPKKAAYAHRFSSIAVAMAYDFCVKCLHRD